MTDTSIDPLVLYPNDPPAVALAKCVETGGRVHAGAAFYELTAGTLRCAADLDLSFDPRSWVSRAQNQGMLRNRGADTDNTPFYTGRGNIRIRGARFNMNGTAGGSLASAMTFAHASGIKIEDCQFYNIAGLHAIDLIGCEDVLVDNCQFHNWIQVDPTDTTPREFIQVDGAISSSSGDCLPYDKTNTMGLTVRKCHFQSGQVGVGSHGDDATFTSRLHERILIDDCEFENMSSAAVRTWHWGYARIRSCSAFGCGFTVQNYSDSVTITDCYVQDAARTAYWINSHNKNIQVRGCTADGASLSAPEVHYGIRASGTCEGLIVTNNELRVPEAAYAMSFDSSVSGLYRAGNTLNGGGLYDTSTARKTDVA